MAFQNIFKDSFVTSSSAGIAAILSAFQGIIVARLLGPESYGLLQIFRIIITYAALASLGTYWAMVREITISTGKKDYQAIDKIRNNTFTINMITRTFAFVVIFFIFQFNDKLQNASGIDTILVCCVVLSMCIYNFLRQYLVAIKEFIVRSFLTILFPLLNFVLVIPSGHFFNETGVLAAMFIAYAISSLYGARKGNIRLGLTFQLNYTKNILKSGAPIFGNFLLVMVGTSIDRLLIMQLLPMVQLGYYGIAVMVYSFLDNLYRSVFLSIFPRLSEKYGETESIYQIKGYTLLPLLISSHITPLFFGLGIILIDPVIRLILPEYTPGIKATQIIIAASFFGCIQVGIENFFITIKKVPIIYPFRILTIFFGVSVIWFSIRQGWGIEGVAISFLGSSALLCTLLLFLLQTHFTVEFLNRLKQIILLIYPFFYMCITLLITKQISEYWQNEHYALSIFDTLSVSLIYIVLNIPIMIIINKRTNILILFWDNSYDWIKKKYFKQNNV